MKVYLASRYSRHPEMQGYRDELAEHGIEVTSRWINGGHEWVSVPDEEMPISVGEDFALEDLEDLVAADVVVFFSDDPVTPLEPEVDRGEEEWRPVAESRLGYEVSSWGRVRNSSGDIILGSPSKGYRRAKPNGRSGGAVPIHQLVAEAFIGPCPPGHEPDHRDGDKSNNWIGNLEYVTHAENVKRAAPRMRGGPHAMERNGRSKITFDQACEIRARYASGETNKSALGREYGVSDTVVRNVINFASWSPEPLEGNHRGGKNVEFGYAMGQGMEIVVVGHRENVFHCLAQVVFCETWDEAKNWLIAERDFLQGLGS